MTAFYAGLQFTMIALAQLESEVSFVSNEFRTNPESRRTELQYSGIEAHDSVRQWERFHQPLYRIFNTKYTLQKFLDNTTTLLLAI